jgi:hypothetical protein
MCWREIKYKGEYMNVRINRINIGDAILIGFIVNGLTVAMLQVILLTLSAFVQSIRTDLITLSVSTCVWAFIYSFVGAIIGGLLWGFFVALYNFGAMISGGGIKINMTRVRQPTDSEK